jgi:hypothetical protein
VFFRRDLAMREPLGGVNQCSQWEEATNTLLK